MVNILPVSDLKNYNEVLKNCQIGESVFLTKHGRSRFVVMDIEDYERDKAEKRLMEKLHEAEEAVRDGNGWLTIDEWKAIRLNIPLKTKIGDIRIYRVGVPCRTKGKRE